MDRATIERGSGDTAPAGGLRCPLCGARYSADHPACSACPLHAGCELVCCPRCGYSWPRESRLVRWIGRITRRWNR